MRIEWLKSAADDLNAISDHLDPLNPAASRRVLSRIDKAAEKLGHYPLIGRPGVVIGTRELVFLHTPYVVIYSVETDHLAIVHIIHGARQWPRGDAEQRFP